MAKENSHPSDQELLLVADSELSARRVAQIRSHPAACWKCRVRMAEIVEVITDLARIHRQTPGPRLPAIAAARERLRCQLAQLAVELHTRPSRGCLGIESDTATYTNIGWSSH